MEDCHGVDGEEGGSLDGGGEGGYERAFFGWILGFEMGYVIGGEDSWWRDLQGERHDRRVGHGLVH